MINSPQERKSLRGELDTRIVDSIHHCVSILDLDGQVLYSNAAGLQFLGREGESRFENRPFSQLFERSGNDSALGAVAAARKGESSNFLVSSRSPSGEMKWWDVTVDPIMTADGHVGQILAISRDVTAQKRKEEFHALERNMLENIMSGNALDEVLEGLVLLIEQYSEDTFCCVLLLGEDKATVQHTTAPSFSDEYARAVHGLPVGPRVGSCGTAMHRRSRVIVADIFSDPLWEGYDSIKTLSGGRACWSTPIISEENEVVGSFAIYARKARMPTANEVRLMDSAAHFARVTVDKHQVQQALRNAESTLAHLSSRLAFMSRERGLGTLATSISHEINQPLIAIQNYAQAVRQRLDSTTGNLPKIKELFAKIEGQAERAGTITKRVRSLVNKGDPLLQPIALDTLLEEVLQLMEPEAAKLGIVFVWEPDKDHPKILVDALQIQLVVINLLRNAFQSIGSSVEYDKRISIDASLVEKETMRISVKDQGPGVSPDRVESIFQPLSSGNTGGMGMGLAISREIIDTHGGQIWYEPGRKGGAVFRFTLKTAET